MLSESVAISVQHSSFEARDRQATLAAMRTTLASLLALLVFASTSCQKSPPPEVARAGTSSAAATGADKAAGKKAHGPIAWRADDTAAAMAEAQAAGKPLFVDAWAPWCHTCLSMQ